VVAGFSEKIMFNRKSGRGFPSIHEVQSLAHDADEQKPVFRRDPAQAQSPSDIVIQSKIFSR
jgi:hypothetical protein